MQDGAHFTATQLVRAGISYKKQCCDCELLEMKECFFGHPIYIYIYIYMLSYTWIEIIKAYNNAKAMFNASQTEQNVMWLVDVFRKDTG
jgi:hypothetical protein